MANKTLFKSLAGKLIPATNAINEECAPAYALSPKHQLAQYAATGCLNTTFYATADEQLAKVIELCAEVDAEFIAKTAVFCRERGFMKDMSALLTASLSVKDRDLLARIFPRVIDNAKMLRNFVQIARCRQLCVKTFLTRWILPDQAFDVISEIARGALNADHWIGVIDSVTL